MLMRSRIALLPGVVGIALAISGTLLSAPAVSAPDSSACARTASRCQQMERERPTVTATSRTVTFGDATTVEVTAPWHRDRVTLRAGGTVIGRERVVKGRASVSVPAGTLEPRERPYRIRVVQGRQRKPATITVERALAKLRSTVEPARILANRTRPRIVVELWNSDGVPVRGWVRIAGRSVKVRGGVGIVRLPAFRSAGPKRIAISYPGTRRFGPKAVVRTIRVEGSPVAPLRALRDGAPSM
jgi:hypothetical protein